MTNQSFAIIQEKYIWRDETENWSAVSNASIGSYLENSPQSICLEGNLPCYIQRIFLPIDTQSLNPDFQILGGYISIYCIDKKYPVGQGDERVIIIPTTQVNISECTINDYSSIIRNNGGSERLENFPPEEAPAYKNISFNASGLTFINTEGGITKIGLIFETDFNSSRPFSGASWMCMTSSICEWDEHKPFAILDIQTGPTQITAELNISESLSSNIEYIEAGKYKIEATLNISESIIIESKFALEGIINIGADISESFNAWYLEEAINISSTLSAQFISHFSVEKTLNLTPTIQTKLFYQFEGIINASSSITHWVERSFRLPSPGAIVSVAGNCSEPGYIYTVVQPDIQMLNYTVIREWGTEYDIAEIDFKGLNIPEDEWYITIEQEDYKTGAIEIIFRGVIISVDQRLKKGKEISTVKAVSEEWYLTQQFVPKDACEIIVGDNWYEPKWWIKYFLGGGNWSAFDNAKDYGNRVFWGDSFGGGWYYLTGVYPYWCNTNVSGWEDYEVNLDPFNYGETTKRQAIDNLCNSFKMLFYCNYYGPFGHRYAYFVPKEYVDQGLLGFGNVLSIDANNDSRFIEGEIKREGTLWTKVNRARILVQIPEYDFILDEYDKTHGLVELGYMRPVEKYWKTSDLGYEEEQLQTNVSDFYDALREGETGYRCTLLSTVRDDDGASLIPGRLIRFLNVGGHNTSYFRIKKITHRKDGSNTPITEIEYFDQEDLWRSGSPKFNPYERMLNAFERRIESGELYPVYPTKYKRQPVLGDTPSVELGRAINVSTNASEQTWCDVVLQSTGATIKNVRVI